MTSATRTLQAADEGRLELEAIVAALSSQYTVFTGPKQCVRRAQLEHDQTAVGRCGQR